ncbi:MAG: cation diffusion facilitator family transporter [Reinekea sp.]
MHDHSNGHGHHHHYSEESNIAIAFFLNLSFTIIELIGGTLTNSTAILADAVHDLGDSLSIGMAWILSRLSKRPSDHSFTYGFQRLTLLGALINGIILTGGSAWVLTETIPRLFDPVLPKVEGMFLLAILGVTVNGYAALRLSSGKTLAERMLNWHLIEDVLGWVAVLIVSIVLYFWQWALLDALLSFGFTMFILLNVIKTLYQTIRIFLQATPEETNYQKIKDDIRQMPNVSEIHHLHLWSLDGARHVLTAHIVLNEHVRIDEQKNLKERIRVYLADYQLEHTTIEFEFSDEQCRDDKPTT